MDSLEREWLLTPVLLPGKFHGQKSLAGYSPWGHKESDTTQRLTLSFFIFTFIPSKVYYCILYQVSQPGKLLWQTSSSRTSSKFTGHQQAAYSCASHFIFNEVWTSVLGVERGLLQAHSTASWTPLQPLKNLASSIWYSCFPWRPLSHY